jgi:hypothetical protein
MNDMPDQPKKRGEAAWIAARDEITKRNAATRKAGKEQREAYELERHKQRLVAEQRRSAELVRRQPGG